jgi:hypothetical protein
MYILNVYEWPYYMCIIIKINCLDIIVTLCIYFEYIKILCKIFAKYFVPILQIYPSNPIILLKIVTNDTYYYI